MSNSNKSEDEVIPMTLDDERKAELTLLHLMEAAIETGEKGKQEEVLNYFGCSLGEYRRLVRKYRHLIKRYRIQRGTYKGEFDDTTPELSQVDIQRAHELVDKMLKLRYNGGK